MATSYSNAGGQGDRRASITVTSDLALAVSDAGNPWNNVVDGDNSSTDTVHGHIIASSNDGNDRNITFDFGTAKVIDEFTFYTSRAGWDFGTWTWEGSNDGSSWTQIGASFTLGGLAGANVYARANSTGYRYYRVHTTSSAGGGSGTL